ncbi:hypothetical protein GCM10009827_039090 [Dactylosporangium maewongense]|uniref:Knr4/Smi1-like domain-containing protein n=1 Tax=Dactylosporangium maewongense TaxID=634393 RepID=A0ABN2AIH9_9ACTN
MRDDQRAALALMGERFPLVEERFRRVYNLRLPRHVAVFAAFWHSLDGAERSAVWGGLGLRTGGIAALFADGGLSLSARDGLDERLDHRYRRDPPELVTIMGGDSDGLHYGLWYDDPADLPTFVAYNWARDTAETWTNGWVTMLGQTYGLLQKVRSDRERDDPAHYEGAEPLEPAEDALNAFADADAEALAQDGPRRWATADRPDGGVTIGPALPPDAGDPRAGRADERITLYRDPETAASIIAEARAELAAGQPAYALVVGRELHWFDADDHRAEATELLVGAYRALGRDALADIAEVHHANRNLRSVDVLAP